MEKVVLKVEGMSCDHCVRAVTAAVTDFDGTADVLVDVNKGTVSFNYDPAKVDLEDIKAAIVEEEFTVVD